MDFKEWCGKKTRDIYSYGLVVWQIARNGKIPFEDMETDEIEEMEATDAAEDGNRPEGITGNVAPTITPGKQKGKNKCDRVDKEGFDAALRLTYSIILRTKGFV